MKKLIEILCDSNGRLSSKRVAGLIGWISVGAMICINGICTGTIPSITSEYMYTSAALIGLGSVLQTIQNKNNDQE